MLLSFFIFFWFWCHFDMLVDADVSEKHTISIFKGRKIEAEGQGLTE
jgi:hypothetical protein